MLVHPSHPTPLTEIDLWERPRLASKFLFDLPFFNLPPLPPPPTEPPPSGGQESLGQSSSVSTLEVDKFHDTTEYQAVVGGLLYLSTKTLHNITYAGVKLHDFVAILRKYPGLL